MRKKPAERCYGAGGGGNGNFVAAFSRWSAAMPQPNDLSRSLVALDQNRTIIAVVELSHSSWLVGGVAATARKHGPLRGPAGRRIRNSGRATPSLRHASGDTFSS